MEVALTWSAEESLKRFERDREAESEQEYAINESCEYFRSVPAVRIA